jgi:putative MATE family efflux protein
MRDSKRSSRLEEFIANPRGALWRLGLPIMLGMSVQTVYMLADMYFVGQVSADALAALAFNMPLVFLGIGIIFGLGSGVTSVIARYIGARDKRLADSSAEHAVALGIVLSAVFTGIAYLRGQEILAALGVPGHLMPLAWGYFRILASGYVFLVMSVFFRSILSGEGDMKTPVMIQGGGTLLNIALDPIFIFTLDMGVEGAALATVISQALAAAAFVYLLFFKEHAYVTFEPRNFRFDPAILASIFKVGAPASFSFIVMALGAAVFNRVLVAYSEDAVAAFQVGSRVDHVFMLPVIALSAGLVTLVGMFYGAKRRDLVRGVIGYAMSRSVMIALVFGVVFYVLAPRFMGAFTDSAVIADTGVSYLRIEVFAYPFLAVVMLTGRALQGMGQGTPVLVLSLLRVVLISGPLAYLFVFEMGKPVEWVWGAIVAGMVVTAAIAGLWLWRALAESEVETNVAAPEPLPGG